MSAYADVSLFPRNAKPLSSYRKFWASRFGVAPFLPMSRKEMDQLLALAENGIAELIGLQKAALAQPLR